MLKSPTNVKKNSLSKEESTWDGPAARENVVLLRNRGVHRAQRLVGRAVRNERNRDQLVEGFVKDSGLHPVSSGEPSKAFGMTFQLCPLPALWLWSCQRSQGG